MSTLTQCLSVNIWSHFIGERAENVKIWI